MSTIERVSFFWFIEPGGTLGGAAAARLIQRFASSIGHNHGLFDQT
jgi:hypothetical protein